MRRLLSPGVVVLLATVWFACRAAPPRTTPSPGTGVLSPPAPQPAVATVTTAGGRTISIRQSEERDPGDVPLVGVSEVAASDVFAGKARKASKLSIVDAPVEHFGSVEALWHSLEDDDAMIGRQPQISHSATSRRVAEEKRRVSVDALLSAASREDDNDFHLIICDDPDAAADDQYCLNVEVSGLPKSGIYKDRLSAARAQFRDLLRGNLPSDRYQFYDPPLPVTITGSLFYDVDHRPGQVGPLKLRPDTSWEIHPVESIVERL